MFGLNDRVHLLKVAANGSIISLNKSLHYNWISSVFSRLMKVKLSMSVLCDSELLRGRA